MDLPVMFSRKSPIAEMVYAWVKTFFGGKKLPPVPLSVSLTFRATAEVSSPQCCRHQHHRPGFPAQPFESLLYHEISCIRSQKGTQRRDTSAQPDGTSSKQFQTTHTQKVADLAKARVWLSEHLGHRTLLQQTEPTSGEDQIFGSPMALTRTPFSPNWVQRPTVQVWCCSGPL